MLLSAIITSLLVLLLYFMISLYYEKHFYQGTKMNGVNISNMTASEAKKKISSFIDNYNLNIQGRNEVTDRINGVEIGLEVVINEDLDQLIEEQNGFKWPLLFMVSKNYSVKTSLTYEEEMLDYKINKLVFLSSDVNIEPKDAYISEYSIDGYSVIKEDQGAYILVEDLRNSILNSINNFKTNLDLEESKLYKEASIKLDNEDLNKKINVLNKYVLGKITYEFGDNTEVVDGNLIKDWISVDDNYQVSLDKVKVREFVDYIGKTYNTFGKTRTLKTSYGKSVDISGGDYGWWLNRVQEVEELSALVLEGAVVTKEPSYYQVANHYGDDDIGNTYVEVNLTAQHLFFYKDGKLVVEADFVSGNLSKEWGTPTGTYPIQYKEREATLTGEDYNTPVDYWMPFNGNIGFHDAGWRNSFGKDIYKTGGSHGCINMPPEAAKIMYEHIKRGVAVYVYELPGTENYELIQKDNVL